jgi:copper chaperone CopZ
VKGIPESENVDVNKLRDLALFGEVGINQDGVLEIKKAVEIDGKTILVPVNKIEKEVPRINPENGAVTNVKLQVMDPEDAKNSRLILVQKDKEGVYINADKSVDSGVEERKREVDDVPGNLLNGNKVPATHVSEAKTIRGRNNYRKTSENGTRKWSFTYKGRRYCRFEYSEILYHYQRND